MNTVSNHPPAQTLEQGVPFGPYRLTHKIGRGGMAEVFLGYSLEDTHRHLPMVIKCILTGLSENPKFLAMFINEAQLAAQMNHPGIVKVLDFGECHGRLYMVMELVNGLDCRRLARRLYPWGEHHEELVVWVACKVLDALEYAHAMVDVNGKPLNLIHRDLSPSNIYLSTDGQVKLGDFGIAKIDSKRYRQVNMIPKGKFGYIAPEQVEGLPVDQRADIFSMGVVLAELLIGKKIFAGDTQLGVMMAIAEGRLDALEENTDRIEPALLNILLKALAREPDRRYSTVSQFKKILSSFLERRSYKPSASDLGDLVKMAMTSDPAEDPKKHLDSSSPLPGPTTGAFDREVKASDEYSWDNDSVSGKDSITGTLITPTATLFQDNYRYSAKLDDGRVVGPASYAQIIELVYSGQIGPTTLVSAGGKNYVPASECPELTRHLPVYTPIYNTDEIETPDRRGVLHIETPSEIALSLAQKQETGALVCTQETRRKEIYFRDGKVVYVSSNDSKELLGEYLVARGSLKREEHEIALALLPRFKGHMGETIIALGILSASELLKLMGEHILARFIEFITWGKGQYEFYKDMHCRTDTLEMPFDVFKAVSKYLYEISAKMPSEEILKTLKGSTIAKLSRSHKTLHLLDLPHAIANIIDDAFDKSELSTFLDKMNDFNERRNFTRALFIAVETSLWSIEGKPLPWRGGNKIVF